MLVPGIIREYYPDLNEEVRQQVAVDSVIKPCEARGVGDDRFIRMTNKFVDIEEININLIGSINSFQKAIEIMSKTWAP
ncbi:hypothetical protein L3H50_08720 [Corynebacterium sp. MC-04]|uniref:Uncharacterized protein n=1 Tax=Corynebacterium parakroppenstedtii TaxID=2828363 RepID=A0ABS9HP08_9CORY|nr:MULTISPECIES: hypothetical protein [Corynebacterium]KXB50052.1 hypothetical protein HMPREF1861_01524 [Corynebacterium kroppenstedtii]MBY0789361.1 hypothetical protein [Corynebacterium parakroppenstedtii]MBY0793526.1 hypothetical protein [Corynebacterium parakroppenstedtii]MBY0797225.1 hypothetical protein [Corynebacterium parakroppenstedtii]MCF6770370.1 hypothetical protein [Corynebacterium parakroppenstedtii]